MGKKEWKKLMTRTKTRLTSILTSRWKRERERANEVALRNGATENGVNDDGADENGLNDDGANENGVNDDGANENGVNDDGANGNGVNDDGTDENGVNDDGATESALARKTQSWKHGQCHKITQLDENVCASCTKIYKDNRWRSWKMCTYCKQWFCTQKCLMKY